MSIKYFPNKDDYTTYTIYEDESGYLPDGAFLLTDSELMDGVVDGYYQMPVGDPRIYYRVHYVKENVDGGVKYRFYIEAKLWTSTSYILNDYEVNATVTVNGVSSETYKIKTANWKDDWTGPDFTADTDSDGQQCQSRAIVVEVISTYEHENNWSITIGTGSYAYDGTGTFSGSWIADGCVYINGTAYNAYIYHNGQWCYVEPYVHHNGTYCIGS